MKFYHKIRSLITNQRFCYMFLITLVALLFGACFSAIFIYITSVYVIILSIFLPMSDILNLYIFFYSFEALFKIKISDGYSTIIHQVIQLVLIFNLFVQHVFTAIKEKKKCNLPFLLLLGTFIIYMALPIHSVKLLRLIKISAQLILVYIVYQDKNQFNLMNVTKSFCLGIIISGLFIFLRPISDYLTFLIPSSVTNTGYPRMIGLLRDVTPALALLCLIRYFDKIDNVSFCIYTALIFYLEILTLSRDLLICFVLIYLTFTIFFIFKNKKVAIKPLLFLLLSLTVVVFITVNPLTELFGRSTNIIQSETELAESMGEVEQIENLDKIISAEVYYDPGRIGLWKLYLDQIFSSPKIMFFGNGIDCNWIGQMYPHNTVLYIIWQHGLIGLVYNIAIILYAIKLKSFGLKNLRRFSTLLILLIPLGFTAVINTPELIQNYFIYNLLIIVINFIAENTKSDIAN